MAEICDIAFDQLQPSQITVGMVVVHEKHKHLNDLRDS
jgi:hypothetical protein